MNQRTSPVIRNVWQSGIFDRTIIGLVFFQGDTGESTRCVPCTDASYHE